MSGKSNRGFACMTPERQREIASKGGRAAHAKGTAHEWSREEARKAGRKGGVVVSRDRDHMSAIGREGGEARSRMTAEERQKQVTSKRRYMEREAMVASGRDRRLERTPAGGKRAIAKAELADNDRA